MGAPAPSGWEGEAMALPNRSVAILRHEPAGATHARPVAVKTPAQ